MIEGIKCFFMAIWSIITLPRGIYDLWKEAKEIKEYQAKEHLQNCVGCGHSMQAHYQKDRKDRACGYYLNDGIAELRCDCKEYASPWGTSALAQRRLAQIKEVTGGRDEQASSGVNPELKRP